MSQRDAIIGVLGAMEAEVLGLVDAVAVEETGTTAGFQYWLGELAGRRVVVARSGMGKVSAAMGVQRMIDEWRVGCVVVCGLAGGLAPAVRVGDIVIGETFVQHDLDASPIFPRFEVPGLGITRFSAPPDLVEIAGACAREVALELGRPVPAVGPAPDGGAREPHRSGHGEVRVHRGLIVTGDQFVDDEQRYAILNDFPDALCVEMEGGAIAQVCHLNAVPFVIVRVISDTADGDAPADFLQFVDELAPAYTVRIVRRLVESLGRSANPLKP
jgi:adenosylhomocysteine nucleosidase